MKGSEPSDDLLKNIHDGEELQWAVRPSRKARFVTKVTSGLFGAAIFGVFIAVFLYTWRDGNMLFAALGFLAPILLQIVSAFVGLLLNNIEYAATDKRLMDYRGRFGRSLNSVPFDGVQDAEYDITAMENLFNVGTVTIDTDRGVETMTFEKTPDPEDFTREIVGLSNQTKDSDE